MHLNSLLFSTLLYTTCIHSYVIPKHDFITLPLLKRKLPSSSSIEKRATTSEQYKLYNADNVEYLTKLYIGTPPQEFLVSIDTGSADTWVPSSKCPSSECPYERFEEEKSSTYEPLNITYTINYAQGSVEGFYVKERMNLLGPDSGLTSPEQTIGLSHSAKEIISGDMKMTSNGILGLSFPALAANSDTLEAYNPFLFELVAKKIINQPVFSISLNEKEGWTSELTIGGINRDKFSGEIRYLPVVKNVNPKTAELDYTFWSVELKGIQIDQQNKSIQVNQKVILDTGTTYSYLSKELVDQIIQDVTQQKPSVDLNTQLYTVDCKLRSSNHSIQFEFDNLKISILLRDFILKPSNEESTECGLTLTYNYDKDQTFILGDNFLKSAFFLFDLESKKVGVATAINSSSKVF